MTLLTKIVQNKTLLAKFFRGQVIIQFLNISNGIFLIRWLSIEQQGLFSIAFGLQLLISSLSDLGFSGSIIALTGDRFNDKKLLGGYMQSAMYLRRIFFCASILVMICVLPLFIRNHFVSKTLLFLNLIPVLAAVYWQANAGIYGTPLIIHKKINTYYRPQLIISALRLAINFVLFSTHYISSLSILTLNALIILYTSRIYKAKAKEYYETADSIKGPRSQMLKYIAPLMPSLIFNAFFGQIQIFIISFFGKINNIAEIAALGKLTQVFVLLSAFNMIIVEPMIAKSGKNGLIKKYLLFFVFSIVLSSVLVISSALFPGLYLFLLGSKYSHLGNQLVLMLAGAGINFVSGTLWTMHSARKWVFWWATMVYIIVIVLCQVVGVLILDLSTTNGVVQLSLLSAIGILVVQLSIGLVGFRKDWLELAGVN